MRMIALLSALTVLWCTFFILLHPIIPVLSLRTLFLIGGLSIILLALTFPDLPDRPYDPREDDPS